jgi:SOS response regulatory protein OraA/RecX
LKADINRTITNAGAIVKTLKKIDSQDQLEVALSRVFKDLQNEFSEPLLEDKTERYKQQETLITRAFEKIEDAIVDVCRTWEIPEDTVRADFDKVKPHLIHAPLIVGK